MLDECFRCSHLRCPACRTHDWRAQRWERLGIRKLLEQNAEAPAAPFCSDSGVAVGGGRAGGKSAAGAEAPPRPHGSPRVSTHSVVAFALVPRMVILCAPVKKLRICRDERPTKSRKTSLRLRTTSLQSIV